jgi:eukaryotic-like serine/threonine-protein kinase
MTEPLNLLDGLDIDLPAEGKEASPSKAENAQGHFFGPYQLIQQVGLGGVARVLRARHIHPRYADTTFAIKILHQELSRDPKVVSLFRHEAYVLSLLKHPNVVQTFEAGSQDGELFIAMEYIDGRDLDNMLLRCRRAKMLLPVPVVIHMVAETLKGLAYAHELADGDGNPLNLVHRDVNPANVFLSYDGRVKLGDFGVASIAALHQGESEKTIAGKVGYFAPEQLSGGAVDQRADLFGVGVLMFEALTGTALFSGDNADEIMRANKRAKIPKPAELNSEISAELQAALLCALERKPEDRFASARAMLQALAPFTPSPVGMPLAVAALMRKLFLNEHIQELEMREGLAGSMARGAGQLVAVCSTDARAQTAFNELFISRGYRATVCPTLPALATVLASTNTPTALLLDVCSTGLTPAGCIGALSKSRRPVPVVAVSDGLTTQWIHFADAIGAVDLVFKPFNIERVLSAVRAAIGGASRIASVTADVTGHTGVRPRLLLISRDPQLIARLSAGLAGRSFEVEVSPDVNEALERTRHASYHAAIFDAYPPSPKDRLFASQFRGYPAMGVVPVIYLTEANAKAMFGGVEKERCAVRERQDPPALLAETLSRLWADNTIGRTFLRYPVTLPLEMRYGGRVFAGQSIDLSRGGLRLRSEQMPPIGTQVGVALRLPTATGVVEITGRVVRVDVPTAKDHHAAIGVEFERFAARGETDYIGYLCTLDPLARRATVLLNQPPDPKGD